ncbi:MAG: D-alanyl-D-alanine carboxypeptidase [Actinomycetota bacterium]|nr:D-alanyl-D-alanine carboxypeptidase [Actinomycetota bacterium]
MTSPSLAPRRSISLMTGLALTAGLAVSPIASGIAAAAPKEKSVEQLVSKRINNPRLGTNVGVLAVDAATGEVLTSHWASASMIPASNMKIVTAVTALATMGPDARFTTKVRSGAAPGEIVLEGGGDPLLSTKELRKLAVATAATLPAGQPVTVRVDEDLFVDTGRERGWTTGYIPSVVASVQPLARIWDYSRDPGANAAQVFAKKLRARGFDVTVGENADAGEAPVIAETPGHTVAEAVRIMLRISENNVAEVLYRQVARATGNEPSWKGSRIAAEQVLANLGIDTSGTALRDGSGLSRKDRVTPQFLVDVVRMARVTNPEPFRVMFEPDAMPISGVSGTLDDRYGRFVTKRSRCAQGDVLAKTGTLFDTITLSGVTAPGDAPERIFSILVNDRPQRYSALTIRQAVDGLTATITGCWR